MDSSKDSSNDSINLSIETMNMSLNTTLGSLETTDASEDNDVLTDEFIDGIILQYLTLSQKLSKWEYFRASPEKELKHNLSLTCLEDFMVLFNMNREMCDKLPTKKLQILNLFSLNRDLIEIFYFVKCHQCKKTQKIKSDSSVPVKKCCDKPLKKSETNFFVYLPIKKQLSQSIANNWSYIKEFDTASKNTDSYSDAHDGEILKNILKQYENDDLNILSLCLNVDGANKFKSNKFSLWPIQFTQNFLPPQIRFRKQNIIVSGLFYTDSDDKLNFRDYLLPLVYELNELKDNNIAMSLEGQDYKFKPIITHCSVDLPAKAKLQETKQFGGYDACTYCEIRGEPVFIKSSNDGKGEKKQNPTDKKPKSFVRYVEGNGEYPLRDETETLKKMMLASSSSKKDDVDGVKDVSCLVAFEHFNILHSVGIEYMHCCLLGAQKRILNLFLDTKNKASKFYITPAKKKLLNSRILAIKPNADVVRKPRSLDKRSDFKASEYRFMLLYYLPVCLEGCVPMAYVKHVRLLSAAIYTLLKTNIPSKEVNEAERMLHIFVKQHEELFGEENMVMVIHLHKHLAESVRKLGPLWVHSAFPFERNNGVLMKMVRGTTDVLLQISSKYRLSRSIIKKKPDSKSDNTKKKLLGKSKIMVEKSLCVLNIESLKELNFSKKDLCVHERLQLGEVTYTSRLYTRPKKSIDYFIGLRNDFIGMAKFYIELDGKIFVVMEEYEMTDFIYHISRVQPTKRNIMAPIDDIRMKFIYMKVGLHHYVTSSPNPYEKE